MLNLTTDVMPCYTVVFDGYSGEPSIKDNEHQRRQRKAHPVVRFDSNAVFSFGKMEEFLSGSGSHGHSEGYYSGSWLGSSLRLVELRFVVVE